MSNFNSPLYELIKATENRKEDKSHSKEYELKLYGITCTSSDGTYENGRESFTQLFTSYNQCIEAAYEDYISLWEELEKINVIDKESCYTFLSKEGFEKELKSEGPVVIQCYDCHFQYEIFEQEIEINIGMLKEKTQTDIERGL